MVKRMLSRGYTLLELMTVVAILATIAMIVAPAITAGSHHKIDLGASLVADAMRYARDEARRTGSIHGISADQTNDRIRVFRLDETANPNLKVFDVRHPITKQLYSIDLAAAPHDEVAINTVGGQMIGTCNDAGNIGFDAEGVVRCVEPIATRIENANIELAQGVSRVTVSVDGFTGRVVIQ